LETHGSVFLPIAHGVDGNFQTLLVTFFIVDPMLPYEDVLTWGERQAAVALVLMDQLLALETAPGSATSVFF
jgi:hypothetical protein